MSVQSVLARIAEIDQSLIPPAQQAPTTSFQATLGAQTDAATPLNATPALTSTAFTPSTGATGGGGVQAMVQAAAGEVGQTEQPPGSNDSPRIAAYRQATAG